jgi:hypothetical protein
MAEPHVQHAHVTYLPFSEQERRVVALCIAICKADAARLGMGQEAADLDDLWLRMQPDWEQVA